MGVMSQAVEQGSGQGSIAEDLGPASEVQIRRNQHTAPLVSLGAELKEERPAWTEAQAIPLLAVILILWLQIVS